MNDSAIDELPYFVCPGRVVCLSTGRGVANVTSLGVQFYSSRFGLSSFPVNFMAFVTIMHWTSGRLRHQTLP